MYKIITYYLDKPSPIFNVENEFKNFMIYEPRLAEKYAVKTLDSNNSWGIHVWICKDWGIKVYDEEDELIYQAGQLDGRWVKPTLYGDEYVDQPDDI